MIYYKKTLLGILKRKLRSLFDNNFSDGCVFLSFLNFKKAGIFFCLFFLVLYLIYLFLFPVYVNEDNTEKIINDYLLKDSKLSLDIEDLKVKPDYKFDISIKAKNIKLAHPENKNFIVADNFNADINILSLLIKKIDFNKISAKNLHINLIFKNNKYTCFDYIDFNKLNNKGKSFSIKNIRFSSKNMDLKLTDKDINKEFNIYFSDFGLYSTSLVDSNIKDFKIISKGKINSPENKIADFNINLILKTKQEDIIKSLNKLKNVNYNPLRYPSEYNFYADINTDLKINFLNPNKMYDGKIKLNNYKFKVNNFDIPKNNALVTFSGNKLYSVLDFNFIKNQFVKIKLNADISKNKYIEANINSSELNLKEVNEVLSALSKIFNIKSLYGINLDGSANINMFIKSNFKTITSSGRLIIKNASLTDKKNKIKLQNINSSIDFADNNINIKDTFMYFDKAKFHLTGIIDSKTNINLKINSEPFGAFEFLNLAKEVPLLSSLIPELKDYIFKSGILKINCEIKGKLSEPVIKINSAIDNFKIFVKSKNIELLCKNIIINATPDVTDKNGINITLNNILINKQNYKLTIPKLKLKLDKNNVTAEKTGGVFENIPFDFNFEIENYKKNPLAKVKVTSFLPSNNDFIKITSHQNPLFTADIVFKNNNLHINKAEIQSSNKPITLISGDIISSNDAKSFDFKNIVIEIPEKIEIILRCINNTRLSLKGKLLIKGNSLHPQIDGNLNLYNIICSQYGIKIKDLILNLNNSSFYLNTANAEIFNQDFDIVTNGSFNNKKLILDNLYILSSYLDIEKFTEYLNKFKKPDNFLEIKTLNGTISSLNIFNTIFNDFTFNGSLNNDTLKIDNFKVNGFNGVISGSSVINLSTLNLKSDLILKEISVRHFLSKLKTIANFSIAVSGKLSSLIQIETNLNNIEPDSLVKKSKIYTKFNIDNGELAQFAKLERLLQAGNILSQSILKLSLNSVISTISSKNTGDFKTIEGTIKTDNGLANIQYIKTQGSNMSLYLTGTHNFLTENTNLDIFGRVPVSIVSILGNIGKFNAQSIVDKMDKDTKDIIDSITASPFEKMMTTQIPEEKLSKIPPLAYGTGIQTREFTAIINGKINDNSSIKYFKWNSNQ